jgi:hypothetical protein
VFADILNPKIEAFAKLVAEAERERIKQANAPEIEKINAHIQKAMTALEEVLAEHAMCKVQRLGQEIEQEPTCPECKAEVLYECVACSSNNYPPPQRTEQEPCVHAKTPKECYRVRCQLGDKCVDDEMSFRTTPPQPEQETVAWPCLIDSADFSENTITLVMQCEDYKVSAGTHWLSTTPPKEKK